MMTIESRVTFMHLAMSGAILDDAIDDSLNDQIDAWHNGDPMDETPLHEYLGMTWREYADYTEGKKEIDVIINDRKAAS